MVDVLVVDDSPQKVARVRAVLDSLANHVSQVVTVGNVRDAVVELRRMRFDLVILDMNLPFRQGQDARIEGGERLIDAIKTDSGIRVPSHIVGLTEFDGLSESFKAGLENDLWMLLSYSAASADWEEKLAARIAHIALAKKAQSEFRYSASVAIVTALHEVELKAVLAVWPELGPRLVENDHSVYHWGAVNIAGAQHEVVAVAATRMGMAAAGILATKVIQNFRPRYLCMCGIAASAKFEQAFGDVLVGSQCWDYGSGKLVGGGTHSSVFKPAPESIPLDEELMAKIEWYKIRHASKTMSDVHERWKETTNQQVPSMPPKIHVGPIASGAAVVADRAVIDQIVQLNRKLVGVEMEGYGVMLAGRSCSQPKPSALVAKSVCDFGDGDKSDEYQRYAAHTSAAFVRDLFENGQLF